MRDRILGIIKLVLAVGIVGWMMSSGKIDFGKLSIIVERPEIMLAAIFQFVVATTFLTAMRWRLLLRGAGLEPSLPKIISLQMIGQFFNVTMPGAVGGDIVKALYVMRGAKEVPKTDVMMTVLLDRIIGMTGVFTLGFLGILWNFNYLWSIVAIRPLVVTIVALVICGAVFVWVIAGPLAERTSNKLGAMSLKRIPLAESVNKIFRSLSLYKGRYQLLLGGWLLSVLLQAMAMFYFAFIASKMMGEPLSFSVLMVVFPIGVLTSALPLAPGGIGVGHLAFDRLFAMVGATGGADVYNVFLLSIIGLSFAGALPYLLYRSDPIYGPVTEKEAGASASS